MSDVRRLVQEAIDRLVESGSETGLQVAVYHRGELVVDAVAGVADTKTGRAVTSSTPFFSASTLKGVTSAVAHVLVQRGALGYDRPIVELWPEFGAHGKESTTLRHVLTHTAGVPGIPADTTREDLTDWAKMTAAIADTEPWWMPGEKTSYHAHTFGYIVGELVRRATGKTVSQVLRDEVAGPLGVGDEVFLAVPERQLPRLAKMEAPENEAGMKALMAGMFAKIAPAGTLPDAEYGNRADILTAEIPAGGTTTARGVARIYAALIGEVDGVRLVSAKRLKEISTVAFSGVDEVMGYPVAWTLGYSPGRPGLEPGSPTTAFGMEGAGGSAAFADPAGGIAFALTRNLYSFSEGGAAEQLADLVTKTLA
jgi:CubicO group peptidase (beta-lactamase class C family)